ALMESRAARRPAILSRGCRLVLMMTLPSSAYSTWAGVWPVTLAARPAVLRYPWAYPHRCARVGSAAYLQGNIPPYHRVRPAASWHRPETAPDTVSARVWRLLAPGRSVPRCRRGDRVAPTAIRQ